MSTTPPASTGGPRVTAGAASMAYVDTSTSAQCRQGYDPIGLDVSNCGAILAAEAATINITNPPVPPVLVQLDKMPAAVQSNVAACNAAGDSCKFLAFDFDNNEAKMAPTMSHIINTRETTVHNAGVFYKDGAKPPTFNTLPGYIFDPTFSYDPNGRNPKMSTVIDERYCARYCDNDAACIGFNYQPIIRKCTVFTNAGIEADTYVDGVVSFTKETIAKAAAGADPPGTNLVNTGLWCGSAEQVAACNADISNVIQNSNITAFSTADLEACAACPGKTVAKTGSSTWAVTNEIETTVITNTPVDTIGRLAYSTTGRATSNIALVPGKFYKLSPYVPSSAFVAKTCLFMKNVPFYAVVGSSPSGNGNNRFLMSGTYYAIPPGVYTGSQFVTVLNTLGTGGTFRFDEAANCYEWSSPVNAFLDEPAALTLLGFKRMTSGTVIRGQQLPPDDNGGFMTYYSHAISESQFSASGTSRNTASASSKMFVLATLGSNASETTGVDGSYRDSERRFTPIIVDYVDNGIILLDVVSGEYMIPAADDSKTTPMPNKYSASYNALIIRVAEASFQDFVNELTAINAEQPLIIRKTLTDEPYMIDPTPDGGDPPYRAADPSYFQIQQFPSMDTYNSYLAANPTWKKYIESRQIITAGYYNGSVASSSTTTIDMRSKTLVKAVNFWNTVRFSERVEIADPTYGCADPNDKGASYTGGECMRVVGTQTSGAPVAAGAIARGIVSFCELCAAGSYSSRTNFKTICGTQPTNSSVKTWCTSCVPGDYCPAGSGSNVLCPVDFYCPTPSQKIECPAGSVCPAGSIRPTPCIAGDYCPAHSNVAADCEAGSYCESVDVNGVTIWGSKQVQCPAGHYCIRRSTVKVACPNTGDIAYYCPPGTRTLNQCPGGFICSDNSTITPCTAGSVCPYGSRTALPCLGDTYFLPQVLTNIQGVLQNQVNVNAPTIQCYSCPTGTTANEDKTGCVCPDANLRWSPYNNKCIADCPIGQSADATGLSCKACADNTYAPVTGLPSCMPCARNFTSTHNADKSGCTCTETITDGTLEWDPKWNRCKVVCKAGTHVPYWSRCFPRQTGAIAVSPAGGSPTPEEVWSCGDGSNNHWGEKDKMVCYRGSDHKNCALGPNQDFYCPSGWSKNGGGNWDCQDKGRNLSCYRGAIVTGHSCSSTGCWTASYSYKGKSLCPVGSTYVPTDNKCHIAATATTRFGNAGTASYNSTTGAYVAYSCPPEFTASTTDRTDCVKAPTACPTGFSGPYCNIPPASIHGVSSNGFDKTQYDVSCVFSGGTNTDCYTCQKEFPAYLGPYYDTAWPSLWKMRCDLSAASIANPNDVSPWGNDSDTPLLDASGNIMMPSIVTQALRSVAPPPPDPTIPCPAGSYMPARGPGAGQGDPFQAPITLVNGLYPGNCIKCDVGNYCNRGYAAQIPCPGGFKCPTPDVLIRCAAGEMCPEGSANPRPCRSGYYCPSAQVVQEIPCPAGSYCPQGSTSPTLCNTGEYCAEGSPAPSDCPPGSYCRNPQTPPVTCRAGTYCPSRSAAEITCPLGSYCPAGSGSAITCAQGKYCPAGSSQQNDSCPAGFYCMTPASMTACPAGTYSTAVGATSADTCKICPAGYTCPYTGTIGSVYPLPVTRPIKCSPGQYCPEGSDTFAVCPPGWYCSTPDTKVQCVNDTVCPTGSISMSPEPKVQVPSWGIETCRAICARGGPGIPAAWNGATCVAVTTDPLQIPPPFPYTCESTPNTTVSCRCQRAYNFGWVV